MQSVQTQISQKCGVKNKPAAAAADKHRLKDVRLKVRGNKTYANIPDLDVLPSDASHIHLRTLREPERLQRVSTRGQSRAESSPADRRRKTVGRTLDDVRKHGGKYND